MILNTTCTSIMQGHYIITYDTRACVIWLIGYGIKKNTGL